MYYGIIIVSREHAQLSAHACVRLYGLLRLRARYVAFFAEVEQVKSTPVKLKTHRNAHVNAEGLDLRLCCTRWYYVSQQRSAASAATVCSTTCKAVDLE